MQTFLGCTDSINIFYRVPKNSSKHLEANLWIIPAYPSATTFLCMKGSGDLQSSWIFPCGENETFAPGRLKAKIVAVFSEACFVRAHNAADWRALPAQIDKPGKVWSKKHLHISICVIERFCGWKKSGDHQLRLVGYPIIYKVYIIIPGLAGLLPSTV